MLDLWEKILITILSFIAILMITSLFFAEESEYIYDKNGCRQEYAIIGYPPVTYYYKVCD